jgi:hypothetical protein
MLLISATVPVPTRLTPGFGSLGLQLSRPGGCAGPDAFRADFRCGRVRFCTIRDEYFTYDFPQGERCTFPVRNCGSVNADLVGNLPLEKFEAEAAGADVVA